MKFGFNLFRSEYDDFGASSSLFGNVRFTNRFTGRFFEVIDSEARMAPARFYRVLPAP